MKSLISLFCVLVTMFAVVFVELEERRMNYVLLQKHRELRKVSQEERLRELQWAKSTKPQQLDKMAKMRLTMRKVESDRVVHFSSPPPPTPTPEPNTAAQKKEL